MKCINSATPKGNPGAKAQEKPKNTDKQSGKKTDSKSEK